MADNDDLYADLYADADQSAPEPKREPEKGSSSSRPPTQDYNNRQGSSQAPQSSRQRSPLPAPSQGGSYNQRPSHSSGGGGGENSRISNPNLPPAGTRADIPEAGRLDDGKMFIGGLSWDTTDEGLVDYFGQFGKISACTVMREPGSGRSRGFAFLTFEDPTSVNEVMVRDHFLDGKTIDPKRAIPRKEEARTDKLFVRNIPPGVTQPQFQDFFQKFGVLSDCTLMMDRDTNTHRGFGFVTYKSEETVDQVVSGQPYLMNGQQIEVKKSSARGRDGGDRGGHGGGGGRYGDRNNAFGQHNNNNFNNNNNMMNPMMGNMMAGFDPQAMADYFKSMGWGSFNPAMMMNPMMMWGGGGNNMGMNMGMGMGMGMDSNNNQGRSRDRGPPPTGPKGSGSPDSSRNNQGGPSRSSRDDRRYDPYGRGGASGGSNNNGNANN